MMQTQLAFGDQLRNWRKLRRLSQLDLALDAEISSRHLSFIETGRSRPSREMVIQLAETLHVPLRDRNALLRAAGFAAIYSERSLEDPAMQAAREAIEMILKGHEPWPALAVDRHWNLVSMNAAVAPLLQGVDERLLQPPVNVLKLSFDPQGLAPRILNLVEWRVHVLARLQRQAAATGDESLVALARELRKMAGPHEDAAAFKGEAAVVSTLNFATPAGVLSMFTTTTLFGTPGEVTLSELAIESFYPANEESRRTLLSFAR
jgi:transcriptional regulator with XRE-family HTH domain